ncbi:MAG: hypothetical protein M1348_02830 [Candidatus Parvarchaeota archaeon]|jgi:hypothetical protein|nr:hypothetical protein [Candidatus Parvarchaeota archaeon]
MRYKNVLISIILGVVVTLLTFFNINQCIGGCALPYNNSNNFEGFPFGWLSLGGTSVTTPPHQFPSEINWIYLISDSLIWSIVVFIALWAYTKITRKN